MYRRDTLDWEIDYSITNDEPKTMILLLSLYDKGTF